MDWETDFTFGPDGAACIAVGVPDAWLGQTVNVSIVNNGNGDPMTVAAFDPAGNPAGSATATAGNGATVSLTGSAGNLGVAVSGPPGAMATFRIGPRTEDGGPKPPNPKQTPAFPTVPGDGYDLKPLVPWINWIRTTFPTVDWGSQLPADFYPNSDSQ